VNDISTKAEILGVVSEEILSKGRATSIHIADVSVEDEVSQMVEAVVAAHRSLDVVRPNFDLLYFIFCVILNLICRWSPTRA
jgi:NAD(P)-dependent dehydrogenase (short-subunit alcohol dehydrogenase family)